METFWARYDCYNSNFEFMNSDIKHGNFYATCKRIRTCVYCTFFLMLRNLITSRSRLITINIINGLKVEYIQGDSYGTRPKKMRISQRLFIIQFNIL
jgi:hypothetical protein